MTNEFDTGDKVVITLKADKGFDSPWLVLRGTDVQDAANTLRQLDPAVAPELDAFDLGLAVAKAAINFRAKYALAAGLNVAPVQPAPAQVAQAPAETFQAPAPAPAPAPQQWGTSPTPQQAQPAQVPAPTYAPTPQAAGVDNNGHDTSKPGYKPQPGPAPKGPSGYDYKWMFGIGKNGQPWSAWLSNQPKADIDRGIPKDPAIWVR